MTVGDLKEMCEDILYTLDNYDDDLKIRLSANTYGIGHDFIASYEGFLPISQIEDRIETGDDDEISDSRRVNDSEDGNDEYIVSVAVVGSESMSNDEAEQYEDELKDALEGKSWNGDGYFGIDLVEAMDRVGEGESVAVWGWCYADSPNTVREAVKQWTANLGYDVRITVRDAID